MPDLPEAVRASNLPKSSQYMSGRELQAAREAAGLTLAQAANLMHSFSWTEDTVVIVEELLDGKCMRLTEEACAIIDRIYGLGNAAGKDEK